MQPDTTTQQPTGPLSLLDSQLSRLPVSQALARFLVVGVFAYVVNQAVLFLLYDVLPVIPGKHSDVDFGLVTHPDARLLIASIIAVEAAIMFKFWAHEGWTFRHRPQAGSVPSRFVGFNASCLMGAIAIVLVVNIVTPVLDLSPYISNSIGAVAGVVANWVFSAYLIWPHARTAEAQAP